MSSNFFFDAGCGAGCVGTAAADTLLLGGEVGCCAVDLFVIVVVLFVAGVAVSFVWDSFEHPTKRAATITSALTDFLFMCFSWLWCVMLPNEKS
jgi:hypothetical protein